ncbi:SdiA-regulated domain-containing protein [Aliarcobacter butzleri]|uniref:SdiA-regulated domain-containing protein n=1 Tax=Aliarcobacter butzleri TaxID=28197 RepID=UPI001261357E|nr:SdiA-regulated domain-containing protein [Aliarcobacter butzleri]
MKRILLINKKLLIFFLTIITFVVIHSMDLDDKLLYKFFHWEEEFSILKQNHKKELVVINEIGKNLSGITYNENTDTLFAITNSPRDIYELDKNGNVLRKISLKGFKDTEDITYIKNNKFAILDEELNGLFIVDINDDTKFISIDDSIKKFIFDIKRFENFGLEGISYDKTEDKFYMVNERNPKKIVSVKGIIGNNQLEVNIKDELLENNFYLADLSAIYFDDIDRRLYVLSDESALLGLIDDKKDFRKYLDLMDNEISSKMKNSEGITRDKEGNIYIVSEPNLFFSIKKE